MRRYLLFFAVFLLLIPGVSWSQTAGEIETLLGTAELSYARTVRFVLEAADAAVLSDPAEAFRFASEWNWLPGNALPDGPVRLDGLSLLIMRAFNLRGGFFYSLFKNSHYAYRELVYRGIIQGRADPKMIVSGDLLLFLVNRVFSAIEVEPRFAKQRPDQAEQEALARDINAQLAAMSVKDTRVQVSNAGITISLSNILFLADSDELENSEKLKLQEVAGILKRISGRRILITGHTALAGTEGNRMQISADRARSVAAYLVSLGARKAGEITVQGFGAGRPIADNGTPEGMALNRRVEITIMEDRW